MTLSDAPAPTTEIAASLPSQLKDQLDHTHALLTAHAGHVPSAVLRELGALQQQFGAQHVRIAVCGEVKAGKSTLLNAIAGADLSPVAFDPLTNVPLRVTHGPHTAWRIGALVVGGLAELEREMRKGDANGEVVVETNLDLLQLGGQVELLDTPGVGSDARMDIVSNEALRALDAIILVVRYPALFTEYTRQLAKRLDQDISKLFVVWNLDASCRALSDGERTEHAGTLRNNLAGAHDVFFVDAQNACENRGADPDNSGLWYLTSALRNFLNSNSRELVALREAAKRAQQLLSTATDSLATRQAMVAEVISAARRQLSEIEAHAKAEIDAARSRLAELEASSEDTVGGSKRACAGTASKLRKTLRRARRRWMWNGNLGELDNSVTAALEDYANTIAQSCNDAAAQMQSAANTTGASCAPQRRSLAIPYVAELAPGGRGTLATMGNWQLLRRTLWRGWYLEGLKHLDRQVVADDLAEQAQWLDAARETIVQAARAATDQQARAIQERAAAETQQVIEETDLVAYEAEAQLLAEDAPALAAKIGRITELATRARAGM